MPLEVLQYFLDVALLEETLWDALKGLPCYQDKIVEVFIRAVIAMAQELKILTLLMLLPQNGKGNF